MIIYVPNTTKFRVMEGELCFIGVSPRFEKEILYSMHNYRMRNRLDIVALEAAISHDFRKLEKIVTMTEALGMKVLCYDSCAYYKPQNKNLKNDVQGLIEKLSSCENFLLNYLLTPIINYYARFLRV